MKTSADAIHPSPSDEEAVAIASAMEALWPRAVAEPIADAGRDTSWKFSGRWWNRPLPSRRDRPYR